MQKFDHNIGFLEKRQFFRRKSPKIVIITSTPGSEPLKDLLIGGDSPNQIILHCAEREIRVIAAKRNR
jgi:hypothetical protein